MSQQDFPKAQRIVYLLSRYIGGVIDFAELQELDNWKRQSDNNRFLFDEMLDEAKQKQAIERMQGYDTKGSLQRIKLTIASSKKKFTVGHWSRFAVAAMILILFGAIVLFIIKPKPSPLTLVKSKQLYIAPGSNKAILTLANGKKITIDDKGNGLIAKQGNASIQKTATGKIIYQVADEKKNDVAIQYNTIETPRGGQYKVQLPDGTNVWLNAASSLRYPTEFTGKDRIVTLTGEAYFEVVHNKAHPFIVRTAMQDVTDIGTSFNINAYSDEPFTATTLLEGAASVTTKAQHKLLKPGLQTINTLGKLTISEADVTLATAWKNGQLAFHHTEIKNMLRQISRWYNIDIEYQGAAPDITVTGGISRKEDLSAVLKMLELSQVHFAQQSRKLLITK